MAAVVEPMYWQRNVDFPPIEVEYTGGPLLPPAGSMTASVEVRLYQGAAGAALISRNELPVVDEPLVSATEPDLRIITIDPAITTEDLMELPGLNTPEVGSDQTFWIEVKLHYDDGEVDSLWLAPFVLNPGVNTL